MLCDNQFCLATMATFYPQLRTQSGESGNTLKNKVQCYGRRESKHLSVPTTCEAECSSQCSVSDIPPYTYTKQASAKTIQWRGSPRLLAHSTAKEKPRRYLRGNALGIEAFRSRHQARLTIARRRCRNALIKY